MGALRALLELSTGCGVREHGETGRRLTVVNDGDWPRNCSLDSLGQPVTVVGYALVPTRSTYS